MAIVPHHTEITDERQFNTHGQALCFLAAQRATEVTPTARAGSCNPQTPRFGETTKPQQKARSPKSPNQLKLFSRFV